MDKDKKALDLTIISDYAISSKKFDADDGAILPDEVKVILLLIVSGIYYFSATVIPHWFSSLLQFLC